MGERILLLGILTFGMGACGGGGGEPLISGTMTGDWDGESFTAVNGFATIVTSNDQQAPVIAMGEGGLGCGSEDDNQPPDGRNVSIVLDGDTFAVGDFSNVFVEMHRSVGGDYEGVGTNSGTVSITAVTAESISGTLAFDYTDNESRHFTANGTFEVVNCVP